MDIFRDYFNREELVRVLSQQPYTPGQLGASNIFETVNLSGTVLAIEEEAKDSGKVLTTIARGAPRQITGLDKRKVHTFATLSYGDQGAVMADEVLNARGNGVNVPKDVIESRRARLVAKLRRNTDLTHEKMRMDCVLSPGTSEFGSAASGVVIAVQTDATLLRKEIFQKLTLPMKAALDGVDFTGTQIFCSDGYWANLIESKSIRDTYLGYQAAAELRGAVTESFVFGGATWTWYRGTSLCKIPDNEARAIPVGAPETFFQAFAPNDTMESVGMGALGQPYYLGSKPLVDSQGTKGWEVSVQSHPKMICGRPACIIPIAMS